MAPTNFEPQSTSSTPPSPNLEDARTCDQPLVQFTLIENSEGLATKQFSFDAEGNLHKRSAGQICSGTATRAEAGGLAKFMRGRAKLNQKQALTYGLTDAETARLVTQRALSQHHDAIARDRDHFEFQDGKPGILMLDHDPKAGTPGLSVPELDAILCEAHPQLADVERAYAPSASAFIYSSDGRELIGTGGWRCYVIVDNASMIPAIGAAFYQRLWELGYGRVDVSKSGQILDRAPVDASVWQAERLDFAAQPVLGEGLERRAPEPVIYPGAPMLRTSGMEPGPSMSKWRASGGCEELQQAKQDAKAEAKKKRTAYIREHVAAKNRPAGFSKKHMQRVITQAVERRMLMADFQLTCEDGSIVSVADVLADPKRYNGARFADPLEPDYRDDNRIACALLGSDPYLYSHAHGGMRYALCREVADIEIISGERPRAVDETLAVMRGCDDLYERGGEIVRVVNGDAIPLGVDFLGDYLGRKIRYSSPTKTKIPARYCFDGSTFCRSCARQS